MKSAHRVAETVWFTLAHKFLPLAAFLAFAIPGVLLVGLLRSYKVSGAENYGGFIMLLGIPALFYTKLVLFTIQADRTMSLGAACASVFYSWLLYLHFIPLVGSGLSRWAERKRARINPFVVRNVE